MVSSCRACRSATGLGGGSASGPKPGKGEVSLTWFEQSHFALSTPMGNVLHVDPFVSRDVIPVDRFIHPDAPVEAGDLQADCVILTHDHADHTDPGTVGPVARRNPQCRFVGPPEAIARCSKSGVKHVNMIGMCEGEEREIGDVHIRAVYARSTGEHDDTTHLGFVLYIGDLVFYNVGDTRADPAAYADRLEAVRGLRPDVMLVPINPGCNNPGPEGAAWLVEWVDPKLVVPCHYGCFKGNTVDPALFLEALAPERRDCVRLMGRCESIVIGGA